MSYIYTSQRLGFRNWEEKDIPHLYAMCKDKRVMEHFPKTLNYDETLALYDRLVNYSKKDGCTYFVTELLSTGNFIGFIGLAYQDYESPFNPSCEIGWRLKHSAWGNGYATEGALRTLQYAYDDLNEPKIIATCTTTNHKSVNVMRKIGMKLKGKFLHPRLSDYPKIQECFWFEINRNYGGKT